MVLYVTVVLAEVSYSIGFSLDGNGFEFVPEFWTVVSCASWYLVICKRTAFSLKDAGFKHIVYIIRHFSLMRWGRRRFSELCKEVSFQWCRWRFGFATATNWTCSSSKEFWLWGFTARRGAAGDAHHLGIVKFWLFLRYFLRRVNDLQHPSLAVGVHCRKCSGCYSC